MKNKKLNRFGKIIVAGIFAVLVTITVSPSAEMRTAALPDGYYYATAELSGQPDSLQVSKVFYCRCSEYSQYGKLVGRIRELNNFSDKHWIGTWGEFATKEEAEKSKKTNFPKGNYKGFIVPE